MDCFTLILFLFLCVVPLPKDEMSWPLIVTYFVNIYSLFCGVIPILEFCIFWFLAV